MVLLQVSGIRCDDSLWQHHLPNSLVPYRMLENEENTRWKLALSAMQGCTLIHYIYFFFHILIANIQCILTL